MIIELRMAWRETRPVLKRFLFVITAIALGVGVLTGLKGFSRALDESIHRSARDLVAGDMAVRMNSIPSPQESAVMESLVEKGAEMTRSTETLSMVSSAANSAPLLSQIRAVDPARFPFYGKVELEPDAPLHEVLTDDSAVVSRDLLIRTGVERGDMIQIGARRFRIAAVLKSEPDRVGVGMDLGPRVLITREALSRSGLIQFGSRASETFIYRFPPRGLGLEEARNIVTSGIRRRVRIADYRNPSPSVSRGLERAANFLSLIGLLSLLVGGLGVSTTIHTYLQQKLDGIAVLKCIGGRSGQIMRIYLVQGLALGVLGSAAGIGLGYVVQWLLPKLLENVVDVSTTLELAPAAAFQGFVIGVFTTLIFLLIPLLAIRRVRPIRVLLREMPEAGGSRLNALRQDPLPALALVILIAGIGLAASWLAGSWRWGFTFLAALFGCILALAAGAKVLLAVLRRVPYIPWLPLRHGIKNLNRPGTHAASVMATLGLGVAFVLTVYFIQTSLITQLVRSAPADFPNVFLLGIAGTDKEAISKFLAGNPGIESQRLIPAVPARLSRIDGRTADELALAPNERRYFQMEFTLTWSESVPPDTRIIEGKWWRAPYSSPLISVGENAAERLKIGPGSVLEFEVGGVAVRGKVANIRDPQFSRPGTSNQFIFTPGSLENLPTSYIGALRVAPARVAALQSSLFANFPNVTSIDVGEVLTRVQDLLNRVSHVIRFIAFFAILSGIIILAAAVVSTRHQRVREVVLLKTLGAGRLQIAAIQAAEFLILGTAAGLIGGGLAAVAAHYLLGNLLDTDFGFRWIPFLTAVAATAALAIATGWAASRGVLNQKPLQVLREN